MIQRLSHKYQTGIAYLFLLLFMVTSAPSAFSRTRAVIHRESSTPDFKLHSVQRTLKHLPEKKISGISRAPRSITKAFIGGPSQPEMSSFKSIGVDNMVNLFTGDFSYNIPLMDVGGYPINIFYDGGVTMDQEASWVGLGWNINPGNISRNTRGVPDDFNGEELLEQTQIMKPNITWGASLGADVEIIGMKILQSSIGVNYGISFNNYLGPALEYGIKGTVGMSVSQKVASEKSAKDSGSVSAGITAGLGVNIGSRSGLTISPNVSMSAQGMWNSTKMSNGLGLSTSYNSRVGIKSIEVYDQMSNNLAKAKLSANLTFAKPSYIPSIRMPITNQAWSGHFQLGLGDFGVAASIEAEVYRQKATVEPEDVLQKKAMIGFLYNEKAKQNSSAVMDFTRLSDNEVTPKTPIISAPQYTYDVFSIQGEGTGGSIRAYRNDLGLLRDNLTESKDGSLSIGLDISPGGHFGANFNQISTPTSIGEWISGNKLKSVLQFGTPKDTIETVYFRNPNETSVLNDKEYQRIGGLDLVRFKLGGSDANPTVEPTLERYSRGSSKIGELNMLLETPVTARKKRTQVTTFLTAAEAVQIGLERNIRSYSIKTPFKTGNYLNYDTISRIGAEKKAHHISEINVVEANGKRYVYGLPVYNLAQKDFSFTTQTIDTSSSADLVQLGSHADTSATSSWVSNNSSKDGYVNVTKTPAYAHSFLLTGLLSPDYVDITGNGISEDDLGDAVKFNYTRIKNHAGNWENYKWRTPFTTGSTMYAVANAGFRTDPKDDKGLISYGERESWYAHSIESKTMIALFILEDRQDGKGVLNELSGVNITDSSQKRLKKIELYSKADIKKNGLSNAKPIKTVWFAYSYKLCKNYPGNSNLPETIDGKEVNVGYYGKLTLDSIYFTFNGKSRASKNKYVFSYKTSDDTLASNPNYARGAADRWGNYRPTSQNPATLKNSDYPYSTLDKSTADGNAAAWSLSSILLPSGAQIQVDYESDDYAFVQNKRAANMFQIAGFGKDSNTVTSELYSFSGNDPVEHTYVYIKVPVQCYTKEQVYNNYIDGLDQFAFKLGVNMPNGLEFVNCYGTIADYGFKTNGTIWIKLNTVDNGLSPITLSVIDFLRTRLPGQAFPGYDVSQSEGIQQVGQMLMGMLSSLLSAFKDPLLYLRERSLGRSLDVTRSFIRANNPQGFKYGGGQRVKAVKLYDNWEKMTGQYTSVYGQEYDYTTTEIVGGVKRSISSGVASYEPAIGGEENPFRRIQIISNQLPLGPALYGAIEQPVLEAFFPAPVVGYSKVSVRSLRKGNVDSTIRSGIGKQVTKFFTAKDFPVYVNHTSLDPLSDKGAHEKSVFEFFSKYTYDSRTLSQGFIVETNDMHGKMRSQSSYAENDLNTPINYTENFYKNTGRNGMLDTVSFVFRELGGRIVPGNMGIDVELMVDTREFSVSSNSLEIQGQVDNFWKAPPVWVPFIWPVTGTSENIYRAVTTTKVINYHSILDSVLVIDKGSQVSTKNVLYDSETGNVILNRTNNEFKQPVYSTTYPAYWAYSGMGLAYKNIGAIYTGVNFYDGKIVGSVNGLMLESGDEVLVYSPTSAPSGCGANIASGDSIRRLWVVNRNKDVSSLSDATPDYIFIDSIGRPYTRNSVSFKITRSGARNLLDATAATITSLGNPMRDSSGSGIGKLLIDDSTLVLNASAVEYREKWQVDNDQFRKDSSYFNQSNCTVVEVQNCNGYLEKKINPYRKGLLDKYRPYRTLVFYDVRRDTGSVETNLALNGVLKNFDPYWKFNSSRLLVPNTSSTKWVANNQLTKVNSRGQELETKDALNVYTSALYGFGKTLPIAIGNNTKLNEFFAESFEDHGFDGLINGNTYTNSCAKKHFDLSNIDTAFAVINTDSQNFSAHTGRQVIRLRQNKTVSVPINLTSDNNFESFSLKYRPDTLGTLSAQGVNITNTYKHPNFSTVYASSTSTSNGFTLSSQQVGVYTECEPDGVGVFRNQFYQLSTFSYIQVTQCSTYNLKTKVDPSVGGWECNGFSFRLFDSNDEEVAVTNTGYNTTYGELYFQVYLVPGIYKIVGSMNGGGHQSCSEEECITVEERTLDPEPTECETTTCGFQDDAFTQITFTNATLPSYINKTATNPCYFTRPLAAKDSMINPSLTVPVGKKMVFSAWVREASYQVPSQKEFYDSNRIEIRFNDTLRMTAKPKGAVIEGWQRYEGYFTAPANSSDMTISFVNQSSSPIYFDDIRIHPFNSNVKSYVYDQTNLRLTAELDANNYATFYEYDEEGTLIRTKIETAEGVKTINETRSFKQQVIKEIGRLSLDNDVQSHVSVVERDTLFQNVKQKESITNLKIDFNGAEIWPNRDANDLFAEGTAASSKWNLKPSTEIPVYRKVLIGSPKYFPRAIDYFGSSFSNSEATMDSEGNSAGNSGVIPLPNGFWYINRFSYLHKTVHGSVLLNSFTTPAFWTQSEISFFSFNSDLKSSELPAFNTGVISIINKNDRSNIL